MTMLRSEIKRLALDRNLQILAASILWVVLTAAAVTVFVLGTIGLYNGLREPCVAFIAQAREFCLERQESLAVLGISPGMYAVILTAGVIVEVLPWIVAGILIFWRKSDELVGIFFSLALVLLGTTALDASLSAWAVFYYPWLAPIIPVVQFVGLACLAVLYVFPDGVFVPVWTRWLALAWVVRTLGAVLFPGTLLDTDALPVPFNSVTTFFIGSFLFSLAWRYSRAANPEQKQQIRWVAAGAAIYGVVYLLRLIPALHAGATVTSLQLGYAFLLYVSSLLLAVCLGISMLRPRLFERGRKAGPQTMEARTQTTEHRAQTAEGEPRTAENRAQVTKGKRKKK